MLFSKHITIPVNRQKTNPYADTIKISKGTVRKVIVLIPVPSAWCVGVSIWYSTSQVWPTSRTEWIPGGLVRIEFEENIKITDVPLEFEVKCYNEDTENEHTVWVGLSIIRPTVAGKLLDFLRFFQGED